METTIEIEGRQGCRETGRLGGGGRERKEKRV